jgi:peptide/nickel transport system substrate-binding protein
MRRGIAARGLIKAVVIVLLCAAWDYSTPPPLNNACYPRIQTNPPQNKTTLKIGTTHKVKSANLLLDPYLSLFAHISNPTLMKMDEDVRPVGQLVEKIGPSPNLESWALELREGLFWSDGKKFTAADVKFSLEYMQEKYPPGGWLKKFISRIEIADEYELVIHLKQPYGRLDFEFMTYPMLPKHIWEKIDAPLKYTNPGRNVGCGPFVIEEVDLNRGLVLFGNNPFWKGPQPHIDGIEVHLYRNRDVLALALEKGEVDVFYEYASSYPYPNLRRLRDNPDFGFLEKLNMGLYFLGWNLNNPPMSDLEFRNAVSYAIDYPEILRIIALGNGLIPTLGFIPPSLPNYKELPAHEFNRDRAVQLLGEAGYQDSDEDGWREDLQGEDIQLELLIDPARTSYARLSELIQDYLQAVGLRVDIHAVEGSAWVNLKDNFRYDIILSRSTPWGMLMHASYASGYFDARRTGEGVLHTVDDPTFLETCDKLLAAHDPATIAGLAHVLQDYYAAGLPAIPLFWNAIITPFNKKYSGWILDPLYGFYNIDNFLNIKSRRN